MAPDWDVAVVGGGPAGSSSAAALSRLGYRVVLLDRAHFPRAKACAEYMSPGVLDALTALGLESAVLRANPLPVPGMDIVAPNGSVIRVDYRTADGALRAYTLPRTVLDAVLVKEASHKGAEIWEGFTARALLMERGAVAGVCGSCDGKQVEISASFTLIADGARSALVRWLGLARSARWPVRLGLVAHYEGLSPLDGDHGQMHVGRDGYCGVAPLPAGRLNVAMVVEADSLRRPRQSATEFFDSWISSQPRLKALLQDCRRVTPVRGLTPVGSRAIRAWTPGALLVGDAAGFFDPFTGEGIFRAITGARIASEVVDQVLSHRGSKHESLVEYGCMRRREFARKSGVTALVQLFVQYPYLLEYAVPRLRKRRAARETLGLVLGDVLDAGEFLRPSMLWEALRP